MQVLATLELKPLAEQVFTSCPWQKLSLGVQTFALHTPVSQVSLALQTVPPATYPSPFAVHKVARVPSHAGWFGAQIPVLQLALAASQYWLLPQSIASAEESPLSAHLAHAFA